MRVPSLHSPCSVLRRARLAAVVALLPLAACAELPTAVPGPAQIGPCEELDEPLPEQLYRHELPESRHELLERCLTPGESAWP